MALASGLMLTVSAVAGAQPSDVDPARPITGPPAPVPPEVVARDDLGQATVRAIKPTEAIRLDGQLDELVYQTTPAIEVDDELWVGQVAGGTRILRIPLR